MSAVRPSKVVKPLPFFEFDFEVDITFVAEKLVSLLDRGPGIPEHMLDVMFCPFVRLEASLSRQTSGAGLECRTPAPSDSRTAGPSPGSTQNPTVFALG